MLAKTILLVSIIFSTISIQPAVAAAQKALDLAVAAKNNELAHRIRSHLELYKQTKPQLHPR